MDAMTFAASTLARQRSAELERELALSSARAARIAATRRPPRGAQAARAAGDSAPADFALAGPSL